MRKNKLKMKNSDLALLRYEYSAGGVLESNDYINFMFKMR